MLEQVGVAPAAPAPQACPDADVLAEDDPVAVAVLDQRRDDRRDIPVRRRPTAGTEQRVVEAEQVEPERRASVGERAQVVRPVDGGAAWPRTTRSGSAPARPGRRGPRASWPHGWRWTETARPLAGGRPPPTARSTRASAGWTGSDVPISPKIPGRIPSSPDPVRASATSASAIVDARGVATHGSWTAARYWPVPKTTWTSGPLGDLADPARGPVRATAASARRSSGRRRARTARARRPRRVASVRR